MESIFKQIAEKNIDIYNIVQSVPDALHRSENVTWDEELLVHDLLLKVKSDAIKTPLRRMQDAVIDSMCDILWEHREYLNNHGGSPKEVAWIDDDLDLIHVAYYSNVPESDYQKELVNTGLLGTLTFSDAFTALSARIQNSDLLER